MVYKSVSLVYMQNICTFSLNDFIVYFSAFSKLDTFTRLFKIRCIFFLQKNRLLSKNVLHILGISKRMLCYSHIFFFTIPKCVEIVSHLNATENWWSMFVCKETIQPTFFFLCSIKFTILSISLQMLGCFFFVLRTLHTLIEPRNLVWHLVIIAFFIKPHPQHGYCFAKKKPF